MYNKLGGMTGTAVTRLESFGKFTNWDVVEIPTNRPMARQDKDFIYKTTREKFNAVIEDVTELSKAGRPVLVVQPLLKSLNY
jgi:preprotein translocase subunit SecA